MGTAIIIMSKLLTYFCKSSIRINFKLYSWANAIVFPVSDAEQRKISFLENYQNLHITLTFHKAFHQFKFP